MNKKIILSSFASLLFLSQAANSEMKVGNIGTLSATAGVMSQYISKGIDQNSDRPTAFGSIDFTAPNSVADFYLGIWSAGATGDNYGKEVDIYAGFKKSFGSVSADLGLVEYQYHGDKASNPLNSIDYYLKLNFAPDKAPYSIGVAYFLNDSKGNRISSRDVGDYYQEVNASYDFGVVKAGISYGEFHNDTNTTTVTLSKSIYNVDFTLAYINAEKDTTSSSISKDREYVTLSASKTF